MSSATLRRPSEGRLGSCPPPDAALFRSLRPATVTNYDLTLTFLERSHDDE